MHILLNSDTDKEEQISGSNQFNLSKCGQVDLRIVGKIKLVMVIDPIKGWT